MALTFFDAFTRIGPRPRVHGKLPWRLEQLLTEMQHCSIAAAMVASTGQRLYDAMLENRKLSQRLAEHDHLFPLWQVMPHWTEEMPEPERLIRLLEENDVRGVVIAPNFNNWPFASRFAQPLLRALEEARVATFMDYGDATPFEIEQVLARHPDLPLIITGAGWAQQHSLMPMVLNFRNLHITFERLQINYGLEWLVEKGCEDQLLFASNAPEMSAGAHRFFVDYADIPQAAKAKVAGGNLSRLLKGLQPPRAAENAEEDFIMTEARAGKPLSVHVVDMHAHILDEGLHGAGGAYTMRHGGPEGTVALARRMGVDAIGLMSWNGTVGVHAEEGNQCVRDALDAAPDSWWGLATFDVLHDSPETMRAQMEETFRDRRFLGLKPYPQYGITYDDPRYDCWWQFGHERKLYCALHPNKHRGEEFDSICSRFPDLTVVGYHCGGSYEAADVAIAMAKKHRNFMIEITLTPVCGGIIDYLAEGAGADRVMYGSDLPMRDPRQQLGWVVYSRLGVEDKKKVLGGNARRLIDRIRADQRG